MHALMKLFKLPLIASTISSSDASLPIALSKNPPSGTGKTLPDSFISFAVELASFPPYSTQTDSASTYSNNLFENMASYSGMKPYFRVGGNSADYTLFNASLQQPIDASQALSNSLVYIGPSFFDGFSRLSNARHSFDFSLMKSFSPSTSAQDQTSIKQIIPYICTGFSNGTIVLLEMGNEPDLYTSHQYPGFTSSNWTPSTFVAQWQKLTQYVASNLEADCPDVVAAEKITWMAPSLFDESTWTTSQVWSSDIDEKGNISQISGHSYITGNPAPTIKNAFLSHVSSVDTLAPQVSQAAVLADTKLPFVLDEVGSILPIGVDGLTNTFGAALWTVDYSLWAASHNISRLYWQQGLNFPYAAWQPLDEPQYPIGTYSPYYANIAVAALLGNTVTSAVQVANIGGRPDSEAIYAVYNNTLLSKVAVVNLQEYNYTGATDNRPVTTYSFQIPPGYQSSVTTQRMEANGTDSIYGITFDGYSYEYDPTTLGMPVRQPNVTNGQMIAVTNGVFSVSLVAGAFCIVNLELA